LSGEWPSFKRSALGSGGSPIAPVHQAKIDSQLKLPRRHLLEVSNAYTNAGGDEWPLVRLKSANGEVMWAQVLQPIVKHAGTNDTPFVRDLKLLKWKSGSDEIKVIISCYWGAGGAEKGVVYLEKDSLAFKSFGLSW
jgi:hypothetical protein